MTEIEIISKWANDKIEFFHKRAKKAEEVGQLEIALQSDPVIRVLKELLEYLDD